MKLIIDIPEESFNEVREKEDIDITTLNSSIRAIENGTPLDDVKAEIEEMRIKFMEQGGVYEHSAYGLDYAIALLNDIGKESEE